MKLKWNKISWNRISLTNLYFTSLVAALLIMLIWKRQLLIQTSLFDEASLQMLQNRTIDGKELFFFVLRERAAVITALFVLGTTTLGPIFVYMNVIWYGAGSGLLLAIVLLRYGLKGILLLVAGMFPQYLIYVPAMILTLQLTRERRTVNGKFCMQLLIILFVMIIGCMLECYVNPEVIAKVLKKF